MICEKCGRNIPTWESECSECAGTTTFFSYEPVRSEPKLTREQFAKHPNMAIARKQITTCAIWMYILVAINIAVMVFFGVTDILLDIIVVTTCAVIIQVKQSKTAAIVFAGYAVLNVVMTIILDGRAGGWLIMLLAEKAYRATAKFQGHWKQYQITGTVPFVTK